MLIGNQVVSINVLREILLSSSKWFHDLVFSDLNPEDHQNYASCVRVSCDEIVQTLDNIDNVVATKIYIKLLRSIIAAYIEKSISC